jgi:lipopolysaccharide transport system permease protein
LIDVKKPAIRTANAGSAAAARILVIRPGGTDKDYWRDLWRFRELFMILAWRDVAVRYKQTIIGVAWAVIRPLLAMVVFTIVFGKVAGLPSEGQAPYSLMVFSALLPWTLFSTALAEASNSLIGNANLISKVYFPRLIVPMAPIAAALVDFLISLGILVLLMGYFQYAPGWNILLLPVFVLLAVLASVGPGLWMAALNVNYRDFRYVVPFVLQFGLYISPVGFSSTAVPERWRLLYSLNPMVGVIDGFRWSILGDDSTLYLPGLLVSTVVILLLLVLGVTQFRKMERTFADTI